MNELFLFPFRNLNIYQKRYDIVRSFLCKCIQVKLGWKHNAKIKALTQNWRSILICMTPKKHTFTAAIRCCILLVTNFIPLWQRTNKQPTGKHIQRKTHSCENWVYLALSMYILFLLYLDYSWCSEPTMIYTYHIHWWYTFKAEQWWNDKKWW